MIGSAAGHHQDARAIFVLGCPRSGTTVLGRYIGSSSSVLDMGEYGALHFSFEVAERLFQRMPSPAKPAYLASLRKHAVSFALAQARQAGTPFFCDHTAWNLLVAGRIAEALQAATFVLVVRNPFDVAQSLARSHADGHLWAGATWQERAELWCRFYAHAAELPSGRTIVVEYETFCATPERTLAHLRGRLGEMLPTLALDFDETVLARSHATYVDRPTIARLEGPRLIFTPRIAEDADSLDPDARVEVEQLTRPVRREIELLCANKLNALSTTST